MAKWLDKYNDGGPVQPNYNDAKASTGPGYVGTGYDTTGRNYSPAWGGQFAMGGALPGATGMMYARTQDPAPSNGKYAKKTKASAQNGTEMKFYQEGLDWKPNNISKNGSVIKDDRGQWDHPGEITEISGNTMATHGYGDTSLYVVPNKGEPRVVEANTGTHKFPGATKFTEFPMKKTGGWLDKFQSGGKKGKLPKATLTDSTSYSAPEISTGVTSGTMNPTIKVLTQEQLQQIDNQNKLNNYLENRAEISESKAPRSALSKAWAMATNPMTAIQYGVAGRGIPEHFDRGPLNPLEHATNIINPTSYINAVNDVPDATWSFGKDPSLMGAARLGGDLLQAIPFTTGASGALNVAVSELSPIVKQGLKTYKATSDIPSVYNRIRNAVYSGTTANELEGDMMHHSYFRMTPEEVASRIAKEKTASPVGAMLGDRNMSINSTPLYFTNAVRDAKNFTPVRTGDMQTTNSFGWRGKRVEEAIPIEMKQKYGPQLLEFKNKQIEWENKIKNAPATERDKLIREKYRFEESENPIISILNDAKNNEPESYQKFIQNYKPEMDRPIQRLNDATGLNFPMSNVVQEGYMRGTFETPTSISIKNPNARVKAVLKSAGKKSLTKFNEHSGLNELSDFKLNLGDIKAGKKLKNERINSINEDYDRNINNLDLELTGENRRFEENYLREVRDNELDRVNRTPNKNLLERQRAADLRRSEQDRQDMSVGITQLMQNDRVMPDRDIIERLTGNRTSIPVNQLSNDRLREVLNHLIDRRDAGHFRQ